MQPSKSPPELPIPRNTFQHQLDTHLNSLLALLQQNPNAVDHSQLQKITQIQSILATTSSSSTAALTPPRDDQQTTKKRRVATLIPVSATDVPRKEAFLVDEEHIDDIPPNHILGWEELQDYDSDASSVISDASEITLDLQLQQNSQQDTNANQSYRQYLLEIRQKKAELDKKAQDAAERREARAQARAQEPEDDPDDPILKLSDLGRSDTEAVSDEDDEDDVEEEAVEGASEEDRVKVVEDFIHDEIENWRRKRLPILRAKAFQYWCNALIKDQSIVERRQRDDLERQLKSLANLKEKLLEGNSRGTELKRMCINLEQTIINIEETRFNISVLGSSQAPPLMESPKTRKVQKVVDDTEPGCVDIGSDLEVESDDEETADKLPDFDQFVDVDDESLYPSRTLTPIIRSSPPPNSQIQLTADVSVEVIDLTEDLVGDLLMEAEDDEMDDLDDEVEVITIDDLDSESDVELINDVGAIVIEETNQPASSLKRKRKLSELQATKRVRVQDSQRVRDDEQRASQNLLRLKNDESFASGEKHVVNIGKSENEDFIYLNKAISCYVKPHQVQGIQFLWRELVKQKDLKKAAGCLLSHTMGLGKTMQAISLLITIAEATASPLPQISDQIPEDLKTSNTLIVCPASLVDNWVQEFDRWLPFPGFLGNIYTIKSSQGLSTRTKHIFDWKTRHGILIIGYNLFRSYLMGSPKSDSAGVADILISNPNLMIVDEAHKGKDITKGIAKSIRKVQTPRRLALTGTPISNRLEEYWSMIDFVHPKYMNSLASFNNTFKEPIERGTHVDSTKTQKRRALTRLKVLEKRLAPKVHRRDEHVLKDLLPPRVDVFLKVRLTDKQIAAYNRYSEICSPSDSDVRLKNTAFYQYVYQANLLCNHPDILRESLLFTNSPENRARRAKANAQAKEDRDKRAGKHNDDDGIVQAQTPVAQVLPLSEGELKELVSLLGSNDLKDSFKMQACLELIKACIRVGDKTLVFSQTKASLEFLGRVLGSLSIEYLYLDGDIDQEKRPAMREKFQKSTEPLVFLISTKAGGEGINLFAANRVILLDFKYSPTEEEQAIGRAYRIGQTKLVYVYRLVADGTAETNVLGVVEFKMQLADKVVDNKSTISVGSKKMGNDYLKAYRYPDTLGDLTTTFAQVEDTVLQDLARFHNQNHFLTNIHTTDIYHQLDPSKLTAEEEREVEILFQEEATGIRNPRPPTVAGPPSSPMKAVYSSPIKPVFAKVHLGGLLATNPTPKALASTAASSQGRSRLTVDGARSRSPSRRVAPSTSVMEQTIDTNPTSTTTETVAAVPNNRDERSVTISPRAEKRGIGMVNNAERFQAQIERLSRAQRGADIAQIHQADNRGPSNLGPPTNTNVSRPADVVRIGVGTSRADFSQWKHPMSNEHRDIPLQSQSNNNHSRPVQPEFNPPSTAPARHVTTSRHYLPSGSVPASSAPGRPDSAPISSSLPRNLPTPPRVSTNSETNGNRAEAAWDSQNGPILISDSTDSPVQSPESRSPSPPGIIAPKPRLISIPTEPAAMRGRQIFGGSPRRRKPGRRMVVSSRSFDLGNNRASYSPHHMGSRDGGVGAQAGYNNSNFAPVGPAQRITEIKEKAVGSNGRSHGVANTKVNDQVSEQTNNGGDETEQKPGGSVAGIPDSPCRQM